MLQELSYNVTMRLLPQYMINVARTFLQCDHDITADHAITAAKWSNSFSFGSL
jgi:hypothetical protein